MWKVQARFKMLFGGVNLTDFMYRDVIGANV